MNHGTAPNDSATAAGLDACLPRWIAELEGLRAHMQGFAAEQQAAASGVHPEHAASARNLQHYLALRSRDLRALQEELHAFGLSSLGRSEAHALETVEALLQILGRLASRSASAPPSTPALERVGHERLARNARALLGEPPRARRVRILVTLDGQAMADLEHARRLLERGMNLARINCAHDTPEVWAQMVAQVRAAERETGRACRILMDLAGPKLRTGPLEPGPEVLRIQPKRDELGRLLEPARLWLCPAPAPTRPPPGCSASLPLHAASLEQLAEGATLRCSDARGARRRLRLREVGAGGALAEIDETTYFVPGIELEGEGEVVHGRVASLPRAPGVLLLRPGDVLILTRSGEPGCAAQRDASGGLLAPARIGCTLPEVFDHVRAGQEVWLDDGRIGARARAVRPEALELVITHARPEGERLRADKGINLPETVLPIPALTAKDLRDLEFVVRHADAVALSFVHEPEAVLDLWARLCAAGRADMGLVLKIETRRAFARLPELLLAALRSPCPGVMIARGDLAVECGFERLAELQEEILWFCEAAHVPVIWATQVLETLAKSGRPSRAEVTDAAMSERAECVMLNKGPYVLEAVAVLDDILRRMEGHQLKKSPLLRPLQLAHAAREAHVRIAPSGD